MFLAMVKKEILLVLRDRHALLALFIMPALFILIMSVALKEQFNQDAIRFSLYINDADSSSLSRALRSNIESETSFRLLSSAQDADVVLFVPKGYAKSVGGAKEEMRLELLIQSSMKSDLLEILKAKLLKSILTIRIEQLKESFGKVSKAAVEPLESLSLSSEKLLDIRYEKNQTIPNSTQQSVPSWIVFGMYFIIIPMSTIFINERKQNTLMRLSSMNVSLFSMTLSKIVPYLMVNQIQVWIMIAVGMYIVPLFDTPALEINGSLFALVVLSLSLSLSAIGLSTLIAVSATSSEQATTIGGILNILLGAVGGIMVPKFIMPQTMQSVAEFSPMSWGLEGFLDIFMRKGDIFMVANESLLLLSFGTIALLTSMLLLHLRIKKGL